MAGMSSSSGRGKTQDEALAERSAKVSALYTNLALFATRIALLTAEIRNAKRLI